MFASLGKTSVDFMAWRSYSFTRSVVCTMRGLVVLMQVGHGAADRGLDVAEGTAVQPRFEQPNLIQAAHTARQAGELSRAELQEFMDARTMLVGRKTDTVALIDRTRERLRQHRRESVANLIETAINQVLSRTISASLTVVLALIPLTIAGGEVLHDFSPALLLGVLIGTHSSIIVASPLFTLRRRPGHQL